MADTRTATQVDEAGMAQRLLAALQADMKGNVPGNAAPSGGEASACITQLHRLSGGANMETWSFDLSGETTTEQLILRRVPGTRHIDQSVAQRELSLATEAELLVLAGKHNVPVPTVRVVLELQHALGEGYVMSREAGEALPGRLLSDERYTQAREQLAFQCGQTLAHIHRIPLAALPSDLPDHSGAQMWQRAQDLLDLYDNASPVLQLAINWLRDNARPTAQRTLVHGDFRNGNLLVDEQGLVAVLDWELAHLGDPLQDLGYITANVWRFGSPKPVGGFGEYDDLLAGYASVSGVMPAMRDIHYWQVHAALSWGLVCLLMLGMYRSGQDPSLERAAIGRRLSEAEIDVLLLLEQELG